MTDEQFTRDIYLATDKNGLVELSEMLGIKRAFVFLDELPADDTRFVLRENFVIATTISGDFRFSAEVYIWDGHESEILSVFQSASSRNVAIVVEDTSENAGPLDEILFHGGKRYSAEIGNDEIFDEVFLTKPKELRKSLLLLSGRANPDV